MAILATSRTPAAGHARLGVLYEFRLFWREFIVAAFHPYRPELHYMRGPGPACEASRRRAARDEG